MDIWETYMSWNSAIAAELVSEESRGRPVYLSLEAEALARVAASASPGATDPAEAFSGAVIATLSRPSTSVATFSLQRAYLQTWLDGERRDPPPCIALLTFFSLVAESMAHDDDLAAHNYYGRLCRRLGAASPDEEAKIRADFAEQSHGFWDAFNSWLDEHDGERGLPTAFAFDVRRHVGIPISQALVRESDRQRLPLLFAHFGLQPGQRLSTPDMVELLQDWLPRSTLSSGLKRAWGRIDVRLRIADIACRELEAWTGGKEHDIGGPVEARIALAGLLRRDPVPRLELTLLVRAHGQLPRRGYRLPLGASPQAQAAFGNCRQPIALKDTDSEDWLTFVDGARISIPDVLLGNVELRPESAASGLLRRMMRRAIPLKWDQVEGCFIETERVELGESYLVLVHESLAAEAERYLTGVAAQGFQRLSSAQLGQLPRGWLAFRDVLVMGRVQPEKEDLNALDPIATVQLSVGSGFALRVRNTWHTRRPPEIRVAASPDEGSLKVTLLSIQMLGVPSAHSWPLSLATVAGGGILSIDVQALPDGDYRALLEREGKGKGSAAVIASAALRLRSGDNPRPLPPEALLWTGHPCLSVGAESAPALGALSASVLRSNDSQTGIRGAVLEGLADLISISPSFRKDIVVLPNRPGVAEIGVREGDDPMPSAEARSAAASCIVGGVHVWVCPPAAPGHVVAREGHCRHCALERRFPRLRRTRSEDPETRRAPVGRSRSAPPADYRVLPHLRVAQSKPIEADLLLDALCFLRAGPWASFVRVAEQISDAPWFATETSQLLSALGHIDVVVELGQPKAWAASPSAIVVAGAELGYAFLAGARSRRLLDALREEVGLRGGRLDEETQSGAPALIRVLELAADGLAAAAAATSAKARLPLVISEFPAIGLAALLPSLGRVAESLPVRSLPRAPDIERYNVVSGRWVACEAVDEPGAYRFGDTPRLYAYVGDADLAAGSCRIGDPRIVKYLAGAHARVHLIGYDASSNSLLTPFGARLPGLYERVAVLCSGRAPVDAQGVVCYQGVPQAVAAMISARLGSGPL